MRRLRLCSTLLLLPACAERADALLEDVRSQGYREAWARAPGWEAPRQPAQGGPHGSHVDIYVNEEIVDALASPDPLDAWPDGSVVAKDGWGDADGNELRFIALMEKRGSSWFWLEVDDRDEVVAQGQDLDNCTGCHDAGADGVRAFGFP